MNLYELERDMDQKWDALCRWKHLGRATHELDRMYDKYLEALNRYIAALQTATLEEKRVASHAAALGIEPGQIEEAKR